MRYSFSSVQACLRAELIGRESVAQTEEFILALAAEAQKMRCPRLLICVRDSRPIFKVEQYRISERLGAIASNPDVRVALVADASELRAAHEYIEVLAGQRGARVRSFSNESDAIKWLNAGRKAERGEA